MSRREGWRMGWGRRYMQRIITITGNRLIFRSSIFIKKKNYRYRCDGRNVREWRKWLVIEMRLHPINEFAKFSRRGNMHNFNIKRYVASFKAVVGILQFTAWLAIQKDELFRNNYVPALPKKCILRSISSYTLTPRAHRLIQSLILSLSISLCPPHQHRWPHL